MAKKKSSQTALKLRSQGGDMPAPSAFVVDPPRQVMTGFAVPVPDLRKIVGDGADISGEIFFALGAQGIVEMCWLHVRI